MGGGDGRGGHAVHKKRDKKKLGKRNVVEMMEITAAFVSKPSLCKLYTKKGKYSTI